MRPPTVTVTSTVEKKKRTHLIFCSGSSQWTVSSHSSRLFHTLVCIIPSARKTGARSTSERREHRTCRVCFLFFFFYIIDSMNDVVLKMRRRQIDHWLYWRLTLSEVRNRRPRRFLQQLKLGHVKPLSLLMKSLCTGFTPAALQLQQ